MKKVYLLIAAALISASSFAQFTDLLNMTPYDNMEGGIVKLGTTIDVIGAVKTPNETSKQPIFGVTCALNKLDLTWSTTLYADANAPAVVLTDAGTKKTYNQTYTIPVDAPLTTTLTDAGKDATGFIYVQIRAHYGTDFGQNVNGDVYANMWIAQLVPAANSAVNSVVADQVSVYPNPVAAGADFTVNAPEGSVVTIYNIAGAKVNADNLAAGLYTVVVTNGSSKVVKKLIVK